MQNDTNAFSPSDIEKMLNINTNTLRKYALALENVGHSFLRTTGGHRQYREKDVLMLQHFIALLPQAGMTLEMAATIVFNKHQATTEQPSKSVTVSQNRSESTEIEQYDERYAQLMAKLEMLDQVPELLKKLQEAEQRDKEKTKKIEELQTLVKGHGQQLERIENGMSQFSIADMAKELHRMQREAAAADAVAAPEPPKRGFWSRLLGK